MMEISTIISTIEKSYIEKLLSQGKRIDGRGLFEFREISVTTNFIPKAEGSADVRLGQTRIMAGIKYDIGTPFPDGQDEGVATCMVEFVPFSSPTMESGPPTIDAIEVARVVDRGIRHGSCIDYKKLCIKVGELVYILFIDLYVMDHYGNLIDTGAIAAMAALVSAKLPKAKLSKDGTKAIWDGTWMAIPMNQIPVSVTFGKLNDHIFIDPSLPEEMVMDGKLSVAVDESNNITSMQKSGQSNWEQGEIIKCTKIAIEKANELRTKLNIRQYAPKL
jgi:exosome complex component RRP42